MTILIAFIVLSFIAAILAIASCMRSSQISREEGG